MYLGNIVSEENFKNNGLFNNINNIENIDSKIPTLIIGWDFAKRIFYDKKLNILNKKIDKIVNWTFAKREKRIEYEKDLNFFIKNSIKKAEKRLKYKYINVLTTSFSEIKNIIKKLISNDVSYIYISKNSFIYLYINGTVFGIDLNMVDFICVDRKKIYKLLFSSGNKVIFSDEFLSKEIKENIENNYKIIPYLYAIENERNY